MPTRSAAMTAGVYTLEALYTRAGPKIHYYHQPRKVVSEFAWAITTQTPVLHSSSTQTPVLHSSSECSIQLIKLLLHNAYTACQTGPLQWTSKILAGLIHQNAITERILTKSSYSLERLHPAILTILHFKTRAKIMVELCGTHAFSLTGSRPHK